MPVARPDLCDKCHDLPHAWFTNEGYLCGVCIVDFDRRQADEALARRIEAFREALMAAHSDDWTMEIIAEAAHICARVVTT